MGSTHPEAEGLGSTTRRASPADAPTICRLYQRIYSTEDAEACDQYPFPQVLDEDWVAAATVDPSIAWVVEEVAGEVVGSSAAKRNIGARSDRIAEVFGIVVSEGSRSCGIATRLLSLLREDLEPESEFILCESRTAPPGGWKVARRCRFLPVGFEPFAHAMPVGSESMILAGWWPRRPRDRPTLAPRMTPAARRLASVVLRIGDPQPCVPGPRPIPGGVQDGSIAPALTVRRDDSGGRRFLARAGGDLDHRAGVIGLRPLEGEGPHHHRSDRPYFVGVLDGEDVGCTRVVWDRTDRRARILEMRASREDVRIGMLTGTTSGLLDLTGETPLIVLANVRADALELQVALEQLGYVPTCYYPGLVASDQGRCDAIQYTLLHRHRIEDGLTFVLDVDWPEARAIVDVVRASDCRGDAS